MKILKKCDNLRLFRFLLKFFSSFVDLWRVPGTSPAGCRIRGTPSHLLAFTLIELLTTIAIISILAGLLLTGITSARGKADSVACRNNLKQLQLCWQLYVNDSNDALPPNLSTFGDDGIWRSTSNSWIGLSSTIKDKNDSGIREGLLFKYDYNRSVALYHCPADKSKVENQLRLRSYSMNGTMGGKTDEVQRVVYRAAEIPAPAKVFVFIDEHQDSIDDAHFLTWAAPDDRWVNMPADRHQKGCTLSFADSHVERWGWRWKKDLRNKSSYWKKAENESDLIDLRRLQDALP